MGHPGVTWPTCPWLSYKGYYLMRVLLDNGIFVHAEFAKWDKKPTALRHSNGDVVAVHGLVRKEPHQDAEYQRQVEALFTVGRLIREGRISAYDYSEIDCEGARAGTRVQEFNALLGCAIDACPPALERSRFRMTTNLRDWFAKGGKEDRKRGAQLGWANQIAFFEWLCRLDEKAVPLLIQHASEIRLTDFEIENFKNIHWFQFLCQRSQSPENYPDVFHLWTPERNTLDAVLTLEKRFVNFVRGVRKEKKKRIEIRTEVLRPLELLQRFHIAEPDPVPMELGRFYYLHEAT